MGRLLFFASEPYASHEHSNCVAGDGNKIHHVHQLCPPFCRKSGKLLSMRADSLQKRGLTAYRYEVAFRSIILSNHVFSFN